MIFSIHWIRKSRYTAERILLLHSISLPAEVQKTIHNKKAEQPVEFSTEKMIGNRMLSQFVFPCIVVNQDFVIVQFFGITAPSLDLAQEKPA